MIAQVSKSTLFAQPHHPAQRNQSKQSQMCEFIKTHKGRRSQIFAGNQAQTASQNGKKESNAVVPPEHGLANKSQVGLAVHQRA